MSLIEAAYALTKDLGQSLPGLAPEIVLVATIVLLLLVPVLVPRPRVRFGGLAFLGVAVALTLSLAQWTTLVGMSALTSQDGQVLELFNRMVRLDSFTMFFRIFLLSFAAMVIWLTALTGIPDQEDAPDFYALLLGATLGMSLMVSANHLLMVY